MRIQDLMNPHVWSIRADATLDAATRIMWNEDIGALPVVDEWNHPIGMVTDRDIAMSATINGQPLAHLLVAQCMSARIHLCEASDSVEAAAGLMRAHQVRRLPVVDESQRLVGILTLGDLARAASRAADAEERRVLEGEVLRTIAGICEPRNGHSESEAVVEVQPAKAAAKPAPVASAQAASAKAPATPKKDGAAPKAAKKKTTRRRSTR